MSGNPGGLLPPPVVGHSPASSTNDVPKERIQLGDSPKFPPIFLQPRVLWPILVISGQLILLIAGWGFFAASRKKPLPLPDYLAEGIHEHPQGATMVVTLIASAISIISGFLYSNAVRFAITASLSRPTSLFAVASGVKVLGKSPITNMIRWKWTIGALACAIALSSQTAGWTTLLTPTPIDLLTPMSGFGLDVSSSDFIQLSVVSAGGNLISPDTFVNVIPLVETSGSAAVSAGVGLPAIFNFNSISFINSTGGILPANLAPIQSVIGSDSDFLPVNIQTEEIRRSPRGFSTNYTVTQQGLTAVVTCEQRDLTAVTIPPLNIISSNETFFNSSFTISQMVTQCPDLSGAQSDVFLTSNPDNGIHAVYAVPCVLEANDTIRFDVIIKGTGNYAFMNTTVCNIAPKVTTVDVNYIGVTSLFNSTWPNFVDVSRPREIRDAPEAGTLPLIMLLRGLLLGQTLAGNSVGDALSTFYYDGDQSDPAKLSHILEMYFTGVFEFGGTLLRQAYTQTGNGLFSGNTSDIPENMRVPMNGTYHTETMGWYQGIDTAPIVLLAPSVVMLISIAIVLVVLLRGLTAMQAEGQDYFDASNILHVISAAAAGGLQRDFPSYMTDRKAQLIEGQDVFVRLGTVDGTGRLGLVESSYR